MLDRTTLAGWPAVQTLAACALWASMSAAAEARTETYYVSSSRGDDRWSGRLPEPTVAGTDGPRASLEAARDLLQSAHPGDRILLRSGDVWRSETGLTLSRAQGTATSPIVLGRYGEGPKPRLESSGEHVLVLRGDVGAATAHLRVEDLVLTTMAAPGRRPVGVLVLEAHRPDPPHHITLSGLEVVGLRAGINLQADDLVVERCIVKDNFGIAPEKGHTQGLFASGHRITIRDNLFEHNGKPDSWFDWNTYLFHGSAYVYERNVVRNAVAGIKLRRADDSVVRDNTFHGMVLAAISLGGDETGGIRNLVVERNRIHDTVNGIVIKDQAGRGDEGARDVVVRNNVLYGNRPPAGGSLGVGYDGCITITDDVIDGVLIANNLVWGAAGKCNVLVDNTAPRGLRIVNNVFHRRLGDAPLVAVRDALTFRGLELDHNLYDTPGSVLVRVGRSDHRGLDELQRAHPGQEASGRVGDPKLADPPLDVRATRASGLLIDRGIGLPGAVDDDLDGRPRPHDGDGDGVPRWDIGPHEWSAPPTDGAGAGNERAVDDVEARADGFGPGPP